MKKLTDTGIKNLKPDIKPKEIPDEANPGLRVRITPRGKTTFVYSYSHPRSKEMRRVTLGTYPAMKLRSARDEWSRLKTIRDRGIDPRDQLTLERQEEQARVDAALRGSDQPITVNDLIQRYLDEYSSRHKKTWREDQRILNKEFGAYHGDNPATTVTTQDIKDLVNAKRADGKVAQARAMIAIIRGMYNWAIESQEGFTTNPAVGIDTRAERKKFRPQPRTRRWHEEELRVLVHRLPEIPSPGNDIMKFMLLSGARISEVVNMEWSEIYQDEWRKPGSKMKNGEPHVCYLSTQAKAILEQQRRSDRWVWPNRKNPTKPVSRDVTYQQFRKVDFEIPHFTPHDFRRAISSWLGKNLVPKEVNDRILAHTNSGVYEIYNVEKYEDHAREWWQKWGDYLEGLENG